MDITHMTKIADMIVESVKARGESGGTAPMDLGSTPLPTRGYWVGGAVLPLSVSTGNIRALLRLEIINWLLVHRPATEWVGWWVHQGRVYVDATDWTPSRGDALQTARHRKEIAVRDIAAGADIHV